MKLERVAFMPTKAELAEVQRSLLNQTAVSVEFCSLPYDNEAGNLSDIKIDEFKLAVKEMSISETGWAIRGLLRRNEESVGSSTLFLDRVTDPPAAYVVIENED